MNKLLLTILLISGLFLALSATAQIDLEQTYPAVPTGEDTVIRCCNSTVCSAANPGYVCKGASGVGSCLVGSPDGICVSPVQQTLTGKSTLPSLIKYLTNWALILAALAVVISLVIGGIQYLTSSGKPDAMTDARKRIGNSFLGLAILAGSYLVLVTINPQLTVMTLVIAPVDSGVVLFTIDGYNALDTDKSLNEIIRDNDAKIFTTDIVDLTLEKDFGPLVPYDTGKMISGTQVLNFVHFPIYAVGFWGRRGGFSDNIRIVAYDDKYFEQSGSDPKLNPREYTNKGKLNEDGNEIDRQKEDKKAAELEISVILIENSSPTDFFLSDVAYTKVTRLLYLDKVAAGENPDTFSTGNVSAYHPPLSIAIKGMGPGAYLYSEKGGQRYITYSHPDLGLSDMKFDNMADEIEINNYEKDDVFDKDDASKNKPTHNYLAVLHDYYHFAGNLRLFFTKAKQKTYIPKIYLHPDFNNGKNVVLCDRKLPNESTCNLSLGINGGLKQNVYSVYETGEYLGTEFYPGNIDLTNPTAMGKDYKTKKVDINTYDVYGAIKGSGKTSSVQLFEMVPSTALTLVGENLKWDDDYRLPGERTRYCEQVSICTEKGGRGNCISYTPGGRIYTKDGRLLAKEYNTMVLPMPYFVPVNIPKKLKDVIKIAGEDDDKYEVKTKKFANKIKSIIIKGDCLVVLYENRLESLSVDLDGNLSGTWEGNTPGSHSEIFLKSDGNLTDNEIARCGSARGIFFGEPKGCASAIAIFPIRVLE